MIMLEDDDLPRVGFAVLSHGNPEQLKRLFQALDRQYDSPAIACHHDFGQADLDVEAFGDNVRFVQPHIKTGWGRFSVVQAGLEAIRLIYSDLIIPQWFVLLSAADYPVMRGLDVRKFLAETHCDTFLDARPIEPHARGDATAAGTANPKLGHFDSVDNQRLKRAFYTSREVWFPILRKDPRLRLGRYTFRSSWKVNGVYDDFPGFYGDHWFCGNARTAAILLHPTERHLNLQRHLKSRTQADETYYQTVLMNEPGFTACLDNKRFAEWNGGGAHPLLLQEQQVEEVLASGAFFARKFAHDSLALDRIDAALSGE
jgi:hypothetical protein